MDEELRALRVEDSLHEGAHENRRSFSVLGVNQIARHFVSRCDASYVAHWADVRKELLLRVLREALESFVGLAIAPESFELVRRVVAVDELQAIEVDGEVAEVVDLGRIDVLLLLLQHHLHCDQKVFIVDVLAL